MTYMLSVFALLLLCSGTWALKERVGSADINRVLSTYDTDEPPSTDSSTDAKVGVYVNNIVIDYKTGIMRMNIYLRVAWKDDRLIDIFEDTEEKVKHVKLNDNQIKKIWRPDLFVRNSDAADRVDALITEHLCRVNRTGNIWYVVRIINNVYCPRIFNGDRNVVCPMMFESFSYTEDVLTISPLSSPVDIDPGVTLRSHTLEDVKVEDCSQNYTAGSFPCLAVQMHMRRNGVESTFESGIYLISIFLVLISWLGFWIPPTEKRVFLGVGVSLVLAMLYMAVAEWREFSFADRTTHGQIWLIFCLALVLAMVLEFALVYVLFGTLRNRLRSLCGGTAQPEDMEPKRSRCGDIVDTVFGLVIFPAIFIIALIAFGSSSSAFL